MEQPLTISEALSAMDSGALTSVELTGMVVDRADRYDDGLGVFVSRFAESAIRAAEQADRMRRDGQHRPLLGIPIAVKDIITTADGPTTGQSAVLDREWGAGDAAVVARLRDAGAVIVGKTTTMEFAFGSPDPAKQFPIPRNPWDPRRWPGGSSSGSASGCAAGMFLGAVGTDTGASVRMPSALSGTTGIKPTYGRVPKSGCVPLGYTLDCIGPMARSAHDCGVLLAAMAGAHHCDPTTDRRDVPHYPDALDGDLTGYTIGVDTLQRFSGDTDPALAPLFADTIAALEAAGATVVDLALPYYPEVTAAAVITILAEASAYHAPDIKSRWADYFGFTRLGLGLAAFASGADYVQAQRVRQVGQRAVAQLFENVDLILTPTVSRPAPLVEASGDYTATLFAGEAFSYHTAYWNALGNPALSMPIGFNSGGLPLAAQLIGRPFDESLVLRAADAYQRRNRWHLAEPPLRDGVDNRAWEDAEPPEQPSDQTETFVEETLRRSGYDVPPQELPGLAASLPLVRHNSDIIYSLAETRYAEPATVFRATEVPAAH
ncbi:MULTISPECIES: amidase [Nocardia]|uniref:Amidase n=2 Tax=Nocardia TaxID=1817 RepID=A0A2T2ZC93_9NOCA|nr:MULTISPECIES: amidase [Nocardia]PSR65372.1 amidase [Nocardia nova]